MIYITVYSQHYYQYILTVNGDYMKDTLKISGILFAGVFTAAFLYPLLHESGHSLAAVAVGAEIKEFNLYPLPSVLCNIGKLNGYEVILIGLGGILLPFASVVFIQPKGFWQSYIIFVMRGICLLSFLISFISILLFYNGKEIANDDMTTILQIDSSNGIIYVLILIILFIWTSIMIVKSHPLRKCCKYFEIS